VAAGHDAGGDGGSEFFGAGQNVLGEIEHAGEFAGTARGNEPDDAVIRQQTEDRIVKFNLNNRRAVKRGFTLIEMILAIGMAAIVLVTISTVLFAAIRMRDATQEVVDQAGPVDQTMTFLRRDLECVVTPTNGTSKYLSGSFRLGNVSSPGVVGDIGIAMFTATGSLSDSTPWSDIQYVTYELRTATGGGSGQDLYRSVTRNLLSASTPQVDDQFLMGGIASVKFSAYDGTAWNDTWDTSAVTAVNTNLPLAVKVEVHMSGDNATEDPITLVVPIDSVARTNMVLATTTTAE
jgi:type II secretion system protein J